MAWQSPDDPCKLPCSRRGTDMCLRHLLSDQGLAPRHLSLGVLQGLKHVYSPNELPACVQLDGNVNWANESEAAIA